MSASAVDSTATSAPVIYLGGWWSRFFAAFLDNVIQIVALAVLYAIGAALDNPASWIVVGAGMLAALFLYGPLLLAFNGGQTLGKKALGLRVVNNNGTAIRFGRAFVREFCFKSLPSALSPFNLVDYLWAAFRDDKRALHDLGAGTVVVES